MQTALHCTVSDCNVLYIAFQAFGHFSPAACQKSSVDEEVFYLFFLSFILSCPVLGSVPFFSPPQDTDNYRDDFSSSYQDMVTQGDVSSCHCVFKGDLVPDCDRTATPPDVRHTTVCSFSSPRPTLQEESQVEVGDSELFLSQF